MNRSATVHIGTSGWHYKHWRGPFYPEKLPAAKMLDYYAGRFDTVELNNSFYHLPLETALEAWRDGTPEGFLFAMKGSRYLTHMKKLKDPELGVARFFERANLLGGKLGPVVFQLPPWWEADAGRLEDFLDVLPRRRDYAFELRNKTWHTEEIYSILRRHNAAFCIFEIAGFFSGVEITADFTYVRLHGPAGAYQGDYEPAALKRWAAQIRDWQSELRSVYFYFDNDQSGFAVKNALELKVMVQRGRGSRTPAGATGG